MSDAPPALSPLSEGEASAGAPPAPPADEKTRARLEKRRRDAAMARAKRQLGKRKTEELEQLADRIESGQAVDGAGAAVEPAAPPPPPADLVKEFRPLAAAAWSTAARILAAAGPRWELQPQELDQLVDATAPVLAKYLPTLMASPETVLAVAVVSVFAPRVIAEVAERRKAKASAVAVKVGAPRPPVDPEQPAPPAETRAAA